MTFSLRAVALTLVLALFGAACGGASSSDTDTAAPGSDTTSDGSGSSDDTGSGSHDPGDGGQADDGPADTPAEDATEGSNASNGSSDDAGSAWEHDWTGDLIGGGQFDANDLAGQDVVIWFWAPW